MVETENGSKRCAEPWNAILRLGGCFEDALKVVAGVKSRSEEIEVKSSAHLGEGRTNSYLVVLVAQR